jgi:hypothetical protein
VYEYIPKRKAPLMQLDAAITVVNEEAMIERAFRYVYGKNVPRYLRDVLNMQILSETRGSRPAPADLILRVTDATERSDASARGYIQRTVDSSIISVDDEIDATEEGSKEYYLSPEQHAQADQMVKYRRIIREVVKIQEDDPYNFNAGARLLPPEIYYHVGRYDSEKDQ